MRNGCQPTTTIWVALVFCVVSALFGAASSRGDSGADEVSYRQLLELERVMLQRDLVDEVFAKLNRSYRSTKKPSPAVRAAIENWINIEMSSWPLMPSEATDMARDISPLLEAAENRLAPLALVKGYYEQLGRREGWERNVREQIGRAHGSGTRLFKLLCSILRVEASATPELVENANGALFEDMATLIEQGYWDEAHERLAFKYLSRGIRVARAPDTTAAWLESARPKLSPWLDAMLTAQHHITAAWVARGSGWANEVTEEGWKGFHEHLAMAKEHLGRALPIYPARPEPATLLIQVTMGAGPYLDLDHRAWFDRVLRSDFTYTEAWTAALWALRPRWGGSHAAMMEIADLAYESGRYDTVVPYQYVRVLDDIANDLKQMQPEADPYAMLKDPDTYAKAKHVMVSYLGRADVPLHARDMLASKLAMYAWKHGDAATSVEQFNLLGEERFVRSEAGRFGMDARRIHEHVAVYASPIKDDLLRAKAAYDSGDHATAKRILQECGTRQGLDRMVRAAIADLTRLCVWSEEMQASGSVVLTAVDATLPGWLVEQGSAMAAPGGGIELKDDTVVPTSIVRTRLVMPSDVDVSCDLILGSPIRNINFMLAPHLSHEWVLGGAGPLGIHLLCANPNAQQLEIMHAGERIRAPLRLVVGSNSIRVVLQGDRMSVEVNGETLFDGQVERPQASPGPSWLALGRSGTGTGTMRVERLTVKPIR